ncbi:MAG: glycosyltransferase [Lachnospiraceae bacterium]|nr:glycosyltransferase [Lachnospiraceae bacterium]
MARQIAGSRKEQNMDKKISVIVPIYNVEAYIAKGIEALCGQTYANLEILLIDDGSTDSSGRICDAYAAGDARIRVRHIENSGQSHARNVGMEMATGELIGFVDGDDAPLPDMYRRLAELMEAHAAEMVECNFVGRNSPPPDQLEEGGVFVLDGREALHKQLDMEHRSRYPSTSVWSKLFKREIIEDLRFPDGRIHEEYCYLCQALYRCRTYVYVNEILYSRTIRKDSTTKERFSLRTLDKLEVHRERNRFLEETGDRELLELSKAQEYNLMIHFYNQADKNGMKKEAAALLQELRRERRAVMESRLPAKKKLIMVLFYFNTKLYRMVRDLKK